MRSLAHILLLTAAALLATAALASVASAASVSVIARGLAQPKKLTVAPNGDLVVALSGDGTSPKSCTSGDQTSCLDHSGSVAAVSPTGSVTTLISGLPSVSSGHDDPQATGPVEALYADGGWRVLFQNTIITQAGSEIYGSAGALMDSFSSFSLSGTFTETDAKLGVFEAEHDPDHELDSDPYDVVAYKGGYAFADAGANDVLWLSPAGKLSLIAYLPTIPEQTTSGKKTITEHAQSVPTSLAVGPDGALYVGELGGGPGLPGKSSIYRIVPGQKATRYATGLSAIEDLAFDPQGRLLVLELDTKGLADPGLASNTPASGAVIRIDRGRKTTLIGSGLTFPTGMAVTPTGTIYLAVNGVFADC